MTPLSDQSTSAHDRAHLRRDEWDQLVRLSQASKPISAKMTTAGTLTGQQASVGLRNLRSRGLVEYDQNPWTHEGRWSITVEGAALVYECREAVV